MNIAGSLENGFFFQSTPILQNKMAFMQNYLSNILQMKNFKLYLEK